MRERPVLFNGAMVRAILDGRKMQTRRPAQLADGGHLKAPRSNKRWHPGDPSAVRACPLGQPGDLLWVRETWMTREVGGGDWPELTWCADMEAAQYNPDSKERVEPYYLYSTERGRRKWRPSVHMPRWASRITLRITDVRVERVRDISEEDAVAEGVVWTETVLGDRPYRTGFRDVWTAIYGAKHPWDTAWCWAVTFERVPNEPGVLR